MNGRQAKRQRDSLPYMNTRELWACIGPTIINGPEDRCRFYQTEAEANDWCSEHERVARVSVTTKEL